jgi:outer membrane protein assembly factor BamB
MKRLAYSLALVVLAVGTARSQERVSIYSNPSVPSREVLDRLNLDLSWTAHIPMENRRDGLFSVQMIETDLVRINRKNDVELVPQIAVQTRSGLVALLNRKTGEVMWQTRVGRPNPALQPLAFDSRAVFHTQGANLYALDRANGSLLWETELPTGLVAAPVADESQIYLALADGRLRAYLTPDMETYRAAMIEAEKRKRKPAEGSGQRDAPYSSAGAYPSTGDQPGGGLTRAPREGPRMRVMWDTVDIKHAGGTPFLAGASWIIPGATGTLFAMARDQAKQTMKFNAGAAILLPPGTFDNMAYIAAENFKVYAVNTETGELHWEFTTGTRVLYAPFVTEEDVFIATEHFGLQRLDRLTGAIKWKPAAAGAERVLATNPKFVYAMNKGNRLLVLDRARGTELSRWDDREFNVPVVNELTDRLLLAAHDGLIVCLRDKEYPKSLHMKNAPKDDGGKFNPLYDMLTSTVSMKDPLDKRPLKDALEFFSRKFNLPIMIQAEAFRTPADMDAFANQPVSLARVDSVPLGEVLNQLLKQIKAKYVVRPGYLQLMPAKNGKDK